VATRLVSLDALRGFTMFWILGGGAFYRVFHELPQNAFFSALANQLTHVTWEGVHFYDLIFPTFIFVSGVSLVLSLPAKIAGRGHASVSWTVIRRAVTLYLIGLWCYGGISHGIEGVRWVGVLQRIAFAYLGAALLFIWVKPKGLIAITIGILLGYWALLEWVPVPGFGAGDLAEKHNLTNYLDQMYLPGKRWDGDHDPEGILSNLPAIATCLLGVFAGLWLVRAETALRKAWGLIGGGTLLVGLGWCWGQYFPLIKKIWTSSYVLEAAGWSCLLLGLFYLVIDVAKIRRWALPFVWIGLNPITLYIIESLAHSSAMADRFVGGDIYHGLSDHLFPGAGALLLALVSSSISIGLAWFLHHRRIYLRV